MPKNLFLNPENVLKTSKQKVKERGMNRELTLRCPSGRSSDPTKGVGSSRQQGGHGGHGSRHPIMKWWRGRDREAFVYNSSEDTSAPETSPFLSDFL